MMKTFVLFLTKFRELYKEQICSEDYSNYELAYVAWVFFLNFLTIEKRINISYVIQTKPKT